MPYSRKKYNPKSWISPAAHPLIEDQTLSWSRTTSLTRLVESSVGRVVDGAFGLPGWLVLLATVAVIMAVAVAVGAFAFWRENRNRNVGIASYVIRLYETVAGSMKLGLLAVVVYAAVYLLHNATGNVTETIQFTLLILGSLVGLQHIRIQAERSRQERDEWAAEMQEAWTKSITAAVVVKDQASRKRLLTKHASCIERVESE